jgi:hypothetical protein
VSARRRNKVTRRCSAAEHFAAANWAKQLLLKRARHPKSVPAARNGIRNDLLIWSLIVREEHPASGRA